MQKYRHRHLHRHLQTTLQPPSSSSLPPASSSQPVTSRLIAAVALFRPSLAALALLLQWRADGGVTDPTAAQSQLLRRDLPIYEIFPGTETSYSILSPKPRRSSDCSSLVRGDSPSFPYFRDWRFDYDSNLRPKICIATTTSACLDQILPWLFFHKVVGVSTFFLFVEGKAASPDASKVLESIPGVKVIYITKELEEQQARSRIWNETWLENFFYQPCNYELFVKQSLNMEMAIVMAREAGMEWILHLDTDELVHPAGATDYSLSQLLLDIPENVQVMSGDIDVPIFQESCVERDDIKDPFSEVSMVKKNFDHLSENTFFETLKDSIRGNSYYFLTYSNGKSAARIREHLRPDGAHGWQNYMKTLNEVKREEAAVLHYTYSKFSDLTSRRERCHCKPRKEGLERCIMLKFDRDAFIIASAATQEEMRNWYHEHVVWGDKELKLKLVRKGILTRIYSPMELRESGVFSSVIASAEATLPNDNFLASTGGINSTKAVGPEPLPSKTMGRR